MNVVCAIVIMSLVVGILGFTTTTIDKVEEGYPAELAGIMSGDKIIRIGGTEIKSWNEVSYEVQKAQGAEMSVVVKRDGETHTLDIAPLLQEGVDAEGNPVTGYVLGVTCKVSHNPIKAVAVGARSTWNMTVTLVDSLKQMTTGEAGVEDLSGPVGMVTLVNQTTEYGFWYYGYLTAFICLNLAVMNMLPLPALDGGRILFALYTAITGKAVSEKIEGVIHFAGMMVLFALMIYVTLNDIIKIVG